MDRILNRRSLILGAGASAASVAVATPVAAEPVSVDREPIALPADGFHTYMAFEALLLRGGSKPLGVTLDISASAGLASVNIRSLSGTNAMWGAIESKDPVVCDFLAQVVERIYTESRQTPDFFPKDIAERPADALLWLSGNWIQCPDCTPNVATSAPPVMTAAACGRPGGTHEPPPRCVHGPPRGAQRAPGDVSRGDGPLCPAGACCS